MNSKSDTGIPHCPKGIDPDSFYGSKKYSPELHAITGNFVRPPQLSAKFNRLLGPSTVWKIFKKQNELISYISQNNCNLMPFTFQTENGTRLFLAAHPITFWFCDEQRNMKDRNSYEIIQEFKVCKLYFDLEFDNMLNSHHDGNRMVDSFVHLVSAALKNRYNISCGIKDVLNFTSSTETKFSCHLIFQLKNKVFCDNYNVGFFVKQLCHEIRLWIQGKSKDECLLLLPEIDISLHKIKELEVIDSKGNRKLFCDEGVYTKNRHFRLYKSSKFGKNVPLSVDKNNQFEVEKNTPEAEEEALFLHSLITWVSKDESNVNLEFPPNKLHYSLKIRCSLPECKDGKVETYEQSPFPDIDKCINKIVDPGKIWRSVFFRENGTIVYDIVGNRFCSNIGRPHKSNNVKYVVDLHELSYYQKCYDPDCADYKSSKKSLPINEHFFLNNNIDDDLIASAEEYCQPAGESTKKINPEDLFYSSHISDEEFFQAVKNCELSHQEVEAQLLDVHTSCDSKICGVKRKTVPDSDPDTSSEQSKKNMVTDHCKNEKSSCVQNTCLISSNSLFSDGVDDLLFHAAENYGSRSTSF